MNQIHDHADPSTFGESFNYAVWTANTTVQCANVPWSADYRDVVYFTNQSTLDSYLAAQGGPTAAFTGLTYAKPGRPIRVNLPFNAMNQYNYLRVTNPAQPVIGADPTTSFYYFITHMEYIAPNVTEIQVQLDVWQTYGRKVKFGNCYIERGHVGIANGANFDDNGRSWLTVPEGLDVGNEYTIANAWEYDIINLRDATTANDYGIIVASTIEITNDTGTVDASRRLMMSYSHAFAMVYSFPTSKPSGTVSHDRPLSSKLAPFAMPTCPRSM